MSQSLPLFVRWVLALGLSKWLAPKAEVAATEERLRRKEVELEREFLFVKQMSDEAREVALKADVMVAEALEETRRQVELNAELLQQGFGITVDAERHSVMVDPERVQVLTQLTARRLDIRGGLVSALFNPFALNVARHLAKKLMSNGNLAVGREAMEAKDLLGSPRAVKALRDI